MSNAKKTLIIVESPSKAKTIDKFLGSNYKVIASVGHIRDLPKSKLGVDVENNYEPQYISIKGKGDIIKEIRKEAKGAAKVFLATDPDREGEAISWHLTHILGIDQEKPCRIMFNEITKDAIRKAIKNPRPIDAGLVDAQQARRVLDRLVGYKISPLLWHKIKSGLSAGRVQSAALKIICDRENQIKAFIPKEYWSITAMLEPECAKKAGTTFSAKLTEHNGKKITLTDKGQVDAILEELKNQPYAVKSVEEKERLKKAFAPFTTSSLQQEASVRLGFQTKKTMQIVQQLYEGVSIKGRGAVGLVTYIRTDSVRISAEAKAAAAAYIAEQFGSEYLGNNVYTNKKRDVQDAHEAIRPSDISLVPEAMESSLTRDQYRLYKLIWSRFVASQMSAAIYDNVTADIQNGSYMFRATGSKLRFNGFLKVYKDSANDEKDKLLPPLTAGETLALAELQSEQHFTQPPPRFTEAGLVKDLEEKNIGRPSTYVPVIATLTDRRYVSREKKTLIPTELGFLVNDFMEKYFREIVDAGFTAEMEDKLDDVEVNQLDWKSVVHGFYETLKDELVVADAEMEKIKREDRLSGENCERCGKPLAIKQGRFGEFLACTGYPGCRNTRSLEQGPTEVRLSEELCEQCGKPLVIKEGRFGAYLECADYPTCQNRKSILQKIGVPCPQCGKEIAVKRGKSGKIFYGCSGYPACNQVYWNKPVNQSCKMCGSQMVEKKSKTTDLACSNKECGYKE